MDKAEKSATKTGTIVTWSLISILAAGLIAMVIWKAQPNKQGFVESLVKHTPVDDLNGTWVNKNAGFSVSIDYNNRSYKGTAWGKLFSQDYSVIEYQGNNIVEFTTKGKKYIAQFNSADEITITRENDEEAVPIVLHRLKM